MPASVARPTAAAGEQPSRSGRRHDGGVAAVTDEAVSLARGVGEFKHAVKFADVGPLLKPTYRPLQQGFLHAECLPKLHLSAWPTVQGLKNLFLPLLFRPNSPRPDER